MKSDILSQLDKKTFRKHKGGVQVQPDVLIIPVTTLKYEYLKMCVVSVHGVVWNQINIRHRTFLR